MVTKGKSTEIQSVPDIELMTFGIVVSEWNSEVTGALLKGAVKTLKKSSIGDDNIIIKHVPGSFELALGGQFFAKYTNVDAIILLGCVIRGETSHFDFVCQGVTQGAMQVNLNSNTPVIFGVLTTDNQQQAMDRAGGILGNKGDEAAITAIKMINLKREFKSQPEK